MQLRIFQILVPLIAIIVVAQTIKRCSQSDIRISEATLISFFWVAISLIALFPDTVTVWVARTFGIEDNVNAILFVAIGALLFLQTRLFFMVKKQDHLITDLTRKIALGNFRARGE